MNQLFFKILLAYFLALLYLFEEPTVHGDRLVDHVEQLRSRRPCGGVLLKTRIE